MFTKPKPPHQISGTASSISSQVYATSIPSLLFASCSFTNSVIQIQVGDSNSVTCYSDKRVVNSDTKAIIEELEDVDIRDFFKDQ